MPLEESPEGNIPAWMRSGLPGGVDSTPPGSFPSQRPAGMAAPNTDGPAMPIKGMPANSLIDEQALPAWLRESQGTGPRAPQENIAASSLIQPEALPEWMKSAPPAPQQQAAPQAPAAINRQSGPIAGSDLIDPQALPQWMTNQPGPAAQAQGQRFDASSLIDPQALPQWMTNQQQQAMPPAQAMPAPQGPAFNGQPIASQGYAGPREQSPLGQPQAQMPANGLAAASLIDMNALPEWLRSSGAQGYPNAPQQPGIPASPTFGSPARVENLRVPGRPRSGMGPQEESAVAANVFSSVLGVSSAAPYFPGQASGQPQMPPPPAYGAGPSSLAQGMPQPVQGNPPRAGEAAGQSMGIYPGYAMPSPPAPAQMPMGYAGGMSNPGTAAAYPGSNAGRQPEQLTSKESSKPGKPAKRSLFEAFRDWLSRN